MKTNNKPSIPILDIAFSILSIAMLVYFSIPKITSAPLSLKGFADFSPSLGLEPLPFMLFTGYLELAIALAFVAGLFLLKKNSLVLWMANFFLFGTMATGLFIEFFARTEAKGMLVVIALVYSIVASVQLKKHLGTVKSWLPLPKSL